LGFFDGGGCFFSLFLSVSVFCVGAISQGEFIMVPIVLLAARKSFLFCGFVQAGYYGNGKARNKRGFVVFDGRRAKLY